MGRLDKTHEGEKIMTLFRQIALAILCIFVLLFFIVIGVTVGEIKRTAQEALYESAQNSATSISLSIDDSDAVQTVINAAFDNGNYEQIVFRNAQGKVTYERVQKDTETHIPQWFEEMVNLAPAIANVTISSGWQILGDVEVQADRTIVYKQLYAIFTNLLIDLALALVVALLLLYLFFKWLLKPLEQVKKQAQAIMDNAFIIAKRIPFTLEFRALTNSMNASVKKTERIFKNANDALKHNKELLYVDPVTQLYNRRYFALKAGEYISPDSSYTQGLLVIVGIARVELLNKLIGYKNTDAFFQNIAAQLKLSFESYEGSLITRLNGTEFVAMVPGEHGSELMQKTTAFSKSVRALFEALEAEESSIKLHLGYCRYGQEENIGKLFAKIDYTLSQTKMSDSGEILEVEDDMLLMGKEQWRDILKEAIASGGFAFTYKDARSVKENAVKYTELRFSIQTSKGDFKYSDFIGPVVELGMLIDFYTSVFKKVMQTSAKNTLSIYLPLHLVACTETSQKVKHIFEGIQGVPRDIVFEFSEDTLRQQYDCSVSTIALIRHHGYDFAVTNFIASSDDYGFLKELKPRYIKISKEVVFDNAQNINLLNILLHSIGAETIVTNMEEQYDRDALKEIGIDCVLVGDG